ncbi:MAG: hypothetical protein IPM95_10510 [Sphingobacteriales bacterium]|nr:hypothetical protein [Sphingobacteriales bacterium]
MRKTIPYLFLLLMIASCKKQDSDVLVEFVVKTTNKTPFGRPYVLNTPDSKILFSNFRFRDSTDKQVLVQDIFLYKNDSHSFSFSVPEGTFSIFEFSFGLDKDQNASIPASFEAAHPLSVESGLYWDMLKYRFLVVEGNIDNSPTKNQTPTNPFSMHIGTDTLYHTISVTGLPKAGSKLTVELDLDKLFVLDADPFQITNFSIHSESTEIPRAIAIKNSFISGIKTTITP